MSLARPSSNGRARALHRSAFAALCGLAALSSACAGLRFRLVNASVRRPSNVAVFFSVDRSNGEPMPGLTADRFRIYEDSRLVSSLESRQTILNPQVSAVHYTLLLVDMSGSVVEGGGVPALQAAALAFSQRVERFQRVGVYAFDGGANIYPIVPFTASNTSASAGISALSNFRPRDPSTNLRGGVVQALRTLSRTVAAAEQPLRFGTLVVFTDGTDRAQRVSRDDMMAALNAEEARDYSIFAIGVGAELDAGELRAIGRTATVIEQNPAQISQAFDTIATRIEGFTQRYYLLSYCSPARAGEHDVRIEATSNDGASGGLEYHFSATGFGPNCDPNTPPAFDTSLRSRRPSQD